MRLLFYCLSIVSCISYGTCMKIYFLWSVPPYKLSLWVTFILCMFFNSLNICVPRKLFKTSLIDVQRSFFTILFFFVFVFRLQSVLFPSFLISLVEAAVSMSAMKYLRYNVLRRRNKCSDVFCKKMYEWLTKVSYEYFCNIFNKAKTKYLR